MALWVGSGIQFLAGRLREEYTICLGASAVASAGAFKGALRAVTWMSWVQFSTCV